MAVVIEVSPAAGLGEFWPAPADVAATEAADEARRQLAAELRRQAAAARRAAADHDDFAAVLHRQAEKAARMWLGTDQMGAQMAGADVDAGTLGAVAELGEATLQLAQAFKEARSACLAKRDELGAEADQLEAEADQLG